MRIAFISALFGAIGGTVGLYLSNQWWVGCIGLMAGLLFGFIFATDVKEVGRACVAAWKEITRKRGPLLSQLQLAMIGWSFLVYLGGTLSLSLIASIFVLGVTQPSAWLSFSLPFSFIFCWATASLIYIMFIINFMDSGRYMLRDIIAGSKATARWINPIGVIVALSIAAIWIFKRIPTAAVATWRFATLVYEKIVCDKRLCGALGVATGFGIGFYEKNPIVGLVLGLVIGLGLSTLRQRALQKQKAE